MTESELAALDRQLLNQRRDEIAAADATTYARIKQQAIQIAAHRPRRAVMADFDARMASQTDYQTARNRIKGGR